MNTPQLNLFTGAPRKPSPDICANRHRGDANSKAANERIQPTKHAQRNRILGLIAEKPRCIHDLEAATGLAANHFSGRITELKAEKKIEKAGRCTHGSGAAIYKVRKFSSASDPDGRTAGVPETGLDGGSR